MKNLDDELRDALRREEPPDGFVERVIMRAEEQAASKRSRPGLIRPGFIGGSKGPALLRVGAFTAPAKPRFVRWLAAAAVVVAMAGAGIQYRMAQIERERAERAAGEAAGQRVMLALQIAGNKLQLVQTRINRMHEPPEKNSNSNQ